MNEVVTPERLDDDEVLYCYRHPGRETALQCSNCGRPICTDCAVAAPVGIKCPECARVPRAARGAVPVARLVRGVVAGIVMALIGAYVYLRIGTGSFFAFFVSIGIGIAIAEAVRFATGGFRDHRVGQIAGAATFVAVAGPVAISLVANGTRGVNLPSVVISVVVAVVGAVYAYNRVS